MRLDTAVPVTFSPGLHTEDTLADYWLRQVTVRLRREITWLRSVRSPLQEDQDSFLPPFSDPSQEALDMTRFWEEKNRFFHNDVTAQFLSEQLSEVAPEANGDLLQGSFAWVVHQLDLNDAAIFVLALGISAAFDNAVGNVIAACMNNPASTLPTLALAQRLWDNPEEILSVADPNHALFRYGLLEPGDESGLRPTWVNWHRPLLVPALVARQLLFPATPLPEGLVEVNLEKSAETETERVKLVAARLRANNEQRLKIVPLMGPRGADHLDAAHAITQEVDKPIAAVTAGQALVSQSDYMDSLATVCWMKGFDLFIDEEMVAAFSREDDKGLPTYLPSLSIPIHLYLGLSHRSQIPKAPASNLTSLVYVPSFGYRERVVYWHKCLEEKAKPLEDAIREGSRRFRFGKGTIRSIARGLMRLEGEVTAEDFFAACRAEVDLDIGELAQRITPRFQEEKLILPPHQARQFDEVAQAMQALTEVHYGWGTAKVWNESGIATLFAGPPGTGKTMGAEILAIKLSLPIYRIDLSQVVNKYIGETEKNLKRLFDAADVSDIILFFDEADSLFGRRTEVKDAHDRYANLEISYLLERMERFKGLAILATNRKRDLDEAFLRRLRYIIDFPLPDEDERKKIWKQVIPKNVDSKDIDFDFLAKQFRLAGGHIRSIVFNACLQSATGGYQGKGKVKLPMEAIVAATKREFDKLDRPVSKEQFGQYAQVLEKLEKANGSN